jgi:hypothetical protein
MTEANEGEREKNQVHDPFPSRLLSHDIAQEHRKTDADTPRSYTISKTHRPGDLSYSHSHPLLSKSLRNLISTLFVTLPEGPSLNSSPTGGNSMGDTGLH